MDRIPTYLILIEPRTKKNSQQVVYNKTTHRTMLLPCKEYRQYEKDCGYFINMPDAPIDYPVNIECRFYRKNYHRCDLTNLLEAIDDILVKYGVIADDNFKIVAGHDGSRVLVDKEHPRTEIYITRLEYDG